MIIFGKKNYNELMDSLIIPHVKIQAAKYRFLPIYKVQITYSKYYI